MATAVSDIFVCFMVFFGLILGELNFQNYRSFIPRKRRALATTDTELKDMAAPAIIGLSKMPKKGYKIPAATGTPRNGKVLFLLDDPLSNTAAV